MNREDATSEGRLAGLIDELTRTFSQPGEEPANLWSELKELEVLRLVLLQHEALRLSKRLGEDRPRARPDSRPVLDRFDDLVAHGDSGKRQRHVGPDVDCLRADDANFRVWVTADCSQGKCEERDYFLDWVAVKVNYGPQ